MKSAGGRLRAALAAGTALALMLAGSGRGQAEGSLSELLKSTHVHGLALDGGRLLIATHHGLHALQLQTGEVTRVSDSRQDFMGFSTGAEGRLYASGHPEAGGNSGVLLSTDGGESWTTISEGADGPVDFHQMAVSAAEPATLYGAFAGRIQRSRDGGESWEVVAPAPEGLIDLAASAADPERLYAATEAGLLVSPDGGGAWESAGLSGAPVTFVEVGPGQAVHAFALGQGLLRAEEEDLAWTLLSEPMGEDFILHFAADGTLAYALTGSGGLLVSDDGGRSWFLAGA